MSYQMAGILSHENDHVHVWFWLNILYCIYVYVEIRSSYIYIFFLNKQGKYIKISYISHKYLKDKKD